MRRLYLAALLVLATAGAGIAQERDYIPDRRAVLIEGVDFPGADLSPQFDVTFEACEAACRADAACTAFTYNRRASACFPKSSVSGEAPYQGAISGWMRTTDATALAAAPDQIGRASCRERV